MRDGRGGDPGWFSWRESLWLLIPHVGIRRLARASGNVLGVLRTVFVAFVWALFAIGVVVVVLVVWASPDSTSSSQPPVAVVVGAVVVFGLVSVLLPRVVIGAPDCSSDTALLGWYRKRFFLRLAIAESAAMVGFVGFVLTWVGWTYLVGASFALVGFARLAPTRRHLEDDQLKLTQAGCQRDLIRVLTGDEPHSSLRT